MVASAYYEPGRSSPAAGTGATTRKAAGVVLIDPLTPPTGTEDHDRFWSALDAVCSREAWEVQGLLNCGKGEPGQMMAVSHGVAPARFRGVQVGIG